MHQIFFFFSTAFLGIFLLCYGGQSANAGPLDEDWNNEMEIRGLVKPVGDENAVDGVKRIFYNNLLPLFRYLFAFIALFVWTIYIVILINSGGDEEKIRKQRENIASGVIGFILISLAISLGDALAPVGNAQDIIQMDETKRQIQKVISFLQMGVTIISIATIFYAGVNFIRSQGEEEEITKSKKYFVWSVIGIVIVMISDPIINTVFYPSPDATLGGGEIKNLAKETGGIIRFFLSFLGVGTVITLVISGFYYVTSFGVEDRQTKAKNIILGSITGIIVILSAYTLVSVFIPK
jgi:uncharacterized membrane protein YidH (DUF202 family)